MVFAPQPLKILTPANIRVLTPDGTYTDEGNAFAVCSNSDFTCKLIQRWDISKIIAWINIFLISLKKSSKDLP
jgi:hypothetical protein